MEWAIIGGTGVYDPEILEDIQHREVTTPFGMTALTVGVYRDMEIAFLARHGSGHSVPPHRINYRANIWALAKLGVRRVVATNAVGSLRERMAPGDLVLCDQFLDFTRGRPATFFEGGPEGVVHVDVSEPYCPQVRGVMAETGRALGLRVHSGATYVCTEGPRFETPAEIRIFDQLAGDLVGMTSVPEVVLAREAGLCYTAVCMVTNYAAGMAGRPLTHEEVLVILKKNAERLRDLIMEAIPRVGAARTCGCPDTAPAVPLPGLAAAGEGENRD